MQIFQTERRAAEARPHSFLGSKPAQRAQFYRLFTATRPSIFLSQARASRNGLHPATSCWEILLWLHAVTFSDAEG